MGIYDREYYREGSTGRFPLTASSMVTRILVLNIVIWLVQLVVDGRGGRAVFTDFLACEPNALFSSFPHVWKLVTANFAHSLDSIWHIAGNMLGLVIFGRELEERLGRREFLTFYLVAGALAILAESILQLAIGSPAARIFGASGSVIALAVLFGTLYPHRIVLLFFVLPVPMWVLCLAFVAFDLLGAFDPHSHVAHFAHLSGAAYGFLYGRFDWRFSRLIGSRVRQRRRRSGVVIRMPSRAERVRSQPPAREVGSSPEAERVSQRIDELLAKIHDRGMDSLTAEELEFLQNNADRYRSS